VVASFDGGASVRPKAPLLRAAFVFSVLASAAAILVQTRAEFVSRIIERVLFGNCAPGHEGLVVQQFRVTGSRPRALLIVAG